MSFELILLSAYVDQVQPVFLSLFSGFSRLFHFSLPSVLSPKGSGRRHSRHEKLQLPQGTRKIRGLVLAVTRKKKRGSFSSIVQINHLDVSRVHLRALQQRCAPKQGLIWLALPRLFDAWWTLLLAPHVVKSFRDVGTILGATTKYASKPSDGS